MILRKIRIANEISTGAIWFELNIIHTNPVSTFGRLNGSVLAFFFDPVIGRSIGNKEEEGRRDE